MNINAALGQAGGPGNQDSRRKGGFTHPTVTGLQPASVNSQNSTYRPARNTGNDSGRVRGSGDLLQRSTAWPAGSSRENLESAWDTSKNSLIRAYYAPDPQERKATIQCHDQMRTTSG